MVLRPPDRHPVVPRPPEHSPVAQTRRSLTAGQVRAVVTGAGSHAFILILVPTRVLFLARFRFERRNPRLERRSLSLGCHSPAGLTPGRTRLKNQNQTGHRASAGPLGTGAGAGRVLAGEHWALRTGTELRNFCINPIDMTRHSIGKLRTALTLAGVEGWVWFKFERPFPAVSIWLS